MAENKKSFVAYSDWKNIFDMLSNEEAGILTKHLFSYVNDENPELEDRVLKMAFEPMKLQLKRDLKKYEGELEKKSINGRLGNLKRWNLDLYDNVVMDKMTLEDAEKIANYRKTSHSDKIIAPIADIDTVTDTVTDNVNVNDIVTVTDSKSHYSDKSEFDDNKKNTVPNSLKNPKQEKEKKSSAKKKETELQHWKVIVEQWFNFYKCHFVVSPTFNAVDGKHLKSIIERCEKLAKAKDTAEQIEFLWPEDRALRTFEKFLLNAWSDKWLQEHFLLKNLSSNFDAIINKKTVGNGNKQQSSSGSKKQFRFSTSEAIKTITGKDQ